MERDVGQFGGKPALQYPALSYLAQAAKAFAFRQRRNRLEVTQDTDRLVKRAHEVLARSQVDASLSTDRRVDLAHERRRNLYERDPAQIRCRHEADEVGQRPATDADQYVAARQFELRH